MWLAEGKKLDKPVLQLDVTASNGICEALIRLVVWYFSPYFCEKNELPIDI